jgi:hypothetical protein
MADRRGYKKDEGGAGNGVPSALVRLKRGYWPTSEKKVKAGELIDLPIDEARRLIAQGIAERGDDL